MDYAGGGGGGDEVRNFLRSGELVARSPGDVSSSSVPLPFDSSGPGTFGLPCSARASIDTLDSKLSSLKIYNSVK